MDSANIYGFLNSELVGHFEIGEGDVRLQLTNRMLDYPLLKQIEIFSKDSFPI